MLERSDLAENALECLHNERYGEAFEQPDLNAQGMIAMGGRDEVSLDGDWFFAIDPYDTGLRQRWYAMSPDLTRKEPWDYSPFEGRTTAVPSCWNMQRPEWYMYEGSVWYTRLLAPEDLAVAAGEKVFLRVAAASYECKVFFNGTFLGRHLGASTPFFVDLTEYCRQGCNWISLCVNAERTAARVPMKNTDWFNYGGVHRSVSIVRTPRHFLRDLHVRLKPGSDYSEVTVSVVVDGPDDAVRVEIPEAGRVLEIETADGAGETTLTWRPDLWSPETPRLYDVIATYGTDRIVERVGFREVRREGQNILLNGVPVFLRGVAVHEDDRTAGRVTSEADIERRIRHVKELNGNFIRLAHYPHHEMVSRLADELGILLWEEIPVYWAVDFRNSATLDDAENQLRELIRRDRNRASVIIWGIGNETPDTDDRLRFIGRLAAVCREMDEGRLVSAACLVNHTRLQIEDRLAAHLDVIGINEYYGWYEHPLEDLSRIAENSSPDRPVVITEFGADGVPVSEGGPSEGLFSEDYQCEVFRRQFEILSEIPWLKGTCPWLLYDFRTERRQNIYQRGFNRKGLICADKATKKKAFEVVAESYARIAQRHEGRGACAEGDHSTFSQRP